MKRTLIVLLLLFTDLVYAAGDPFGKATSKLNEAAQFIGGPFAIAVFAIAVMVAGFGLAMHKVQKETAIKILAGGIIVSSAAAIAGWALS